MSDLLKSLKEKTAEINKIRTDLVKELQPKFGEIFLPILTKYPQLQAITWTQYTPHFNDGEPCEFNVGDLYFCVAGIHDVEDNHYEWEECKVNDYYFDPSDSSYEKDWVREKREKYLVAFGDLEKVNEFRKDWDDVRTAFNDIPQDVMRDLFNDHAQVTVNRAGLTAEEYDHD